MLFTLHPLLKFYYRNVCSLRAKHSILAFNFFSSSLQLCSPSPASCSALAEVTVKMKCMLAIEAKRANENYATNEIASGTYIGNMSSHLGDETNYFLLMTRITAIYDWQFIYCPWHLFARECSTSMSFAFARHFVQFRPLSLSLTTPTSQRLKSFVRILSIVSVGSPLRRMNKSKSIIRFYYEYSLLPLIIINTHGNDMESMRTESFCEEIAINLYIHLFQMKNHKKFKIIHTNSDFFSCVRSCGWRTSWLCARAGTQIIIAHWIMLWINNQTWLWRCCEDDDDDGRSMKETRMCGVAGRRRRRPTDISVPWSFRVSRFYLTRFHDVHSHSWTAKQFTRSKRKKKHNKNIRSRKRDEKKNLVPAWMTFTLARWNM